MTRPTLNKLSTLGKTSWIRNCVLATAALGGIMGALAVGFSGDARAQDVSRQYVNAEWGYALNVPTTWAPAPANGTYETARFISPQNEQLTVFLRPHNGGQLTAAHAASSHSTALLTSQGYANFVSGQALVNSKSVPVLEYTSLDTKVPVYGRRYFFSGKENLYVLSFEGKSPEEVTALSQQVVQTFTFP
jgi:hypothetical protein